MSYRRYWVLKTVPEEERSYMSIERYDDELSSKYVYDNSVANHKQLKPGDIVVLIDKKSVIGFAKIENIETNKDVKIRRRCPECGSTNYEVRKSKTPIFRCNHGHKFDELISETVGILKYIASYKNAFLTPTKTISIEKLKPFYHNNYNRNMSIQSLDVTFLKEYFPEVENAFNGKTYLSPFEALKAEDSGWGYYPDDSDERGVVLRQIKARRGQQKFRDELLKLYGGSCMVTGCNILDIIEAAHIVPYKGIKDNHYKNGLLLRADIHTLFDLNLLAIEPKSLIIFIHEKALNSGYEVFHKTPLKIINEEERPSKNALEIRWKIFDSKN